MPDSFPALEGVRTNLFRQIQTLGDSRPAPIGARLRRSVKPTSHCPKPTTAPPPHSANVRRTSARLRASRPSMPPSLGVTRRSAASAPSSRGRVVGRPRKKNGCCDPSRSRSRSRRPPPEDLRGTTPDRWPGFGSCGDGVSYNHASSRGGGLDPTVNRGATPAAPSSLRLWRHGRLSRVAVQVGAHCGGACPHAPPLLFVLRLP